MRSFFWRVFLANLLTLLVALGTVGLLLNATFRNLYYKRASEHLLATATDMARQLEPLLSDSERRRELETLRVAMERSSQLRGTGRHPRSRCPSSARWPDYRCALGARPLRRADAHRSCALYRPPGQ